LITINLKINKNLKDIVDSSNINKNMLLINDGSKVKDLLIQLAGKEPKGILVIVNNEIASPMTTLKNNDQVEIMPIFAGG